MTHPLTQGMCEELSCFPFEECDQDGLIHDMRAAYDKGYDKGAEDRLEQVIKCLEANKDLSVEIILRFIRPALPPLENNQ